MVTVIGVRFRAAGKIYYFSPGKLEIKNGDHVIVETARGIEYGHVVLGNRDVEDNKVVQPLKAVIRMANKEDIAREEANRKKEKDAFKICQEKIRKHKLEMKLIDVEAVAIVLSIIILTVAQILSFSISELPLNIGVTPAICNIFAGVLYCVFAFLGTKLLCQKLLKTSLLELKIPRFKVKAVWIISALTMPALVLLIAILLGGHWEINTFNSTDRNATITGAIFFYGLATGIVEELIFRGIIMGCLEKRFNIQIAVIVSSVLFGLLHIIGNDLNFISIIQLLIAGSIVGVLFSLIAYGSNSIWNSAIVHGIWNIVIIGGILHIGNEADSSSIFNFILDNKSFLISGGDFGIEASIISILVYLLFIVLAAIQVKRKGTKSKIE